MMIASVPLINTGDDHIGWMKRKSGPAWRNTARSELLTAPLDITQVYTMQFLQEVYGK